MARVRVLQVLSILAFICGLDAAKILFFFPGGTFSHKTSVWPLVTALADRGHNVTVVSSFKKKPVDHPTVVDIAPAAMVQQVTKQFQNVDRLSKRLRYEERLVWGNYHKDVIKQCAALFESVKTEPELNNIFHREHYDILVNNVVFGDCGFVLAYRLMQQGGKMILYSSTMRSMHYPEQFGLPDESSWIPGMPQLITGSELTFWDRFTNYFESIYWYLLRQWELFPPLERMMEEIYQMKTAPPLIEVERNASLVFLAVHHGTDFARSMPPFMVNIGGMQCWQKRKPFEGEMKEFLDNAKDGAVLIAFGSTIDLSIMPEYFKNVFFQMMTKFPKVQFIWRWDGPLPENHPKNLKVSKWLPQYEILGHPNLKAFISHAGLNSVTEATCQGVPIILMPMFADQDFNAYRIEKYEVGLRLEIRTLTPEIMEDAVRKILTDEKYAQNMKHLSGIMTDRPMSPVETGVYWTEFVLRHNNTNSLKPLNNLNFFQRRMFDVLLLLSFLTATAMVAGFLICTSLCRSKNVTRASSKSAQAATKQKKL